MSGGHSNTLHATSAFGPSGVSSHDHTIISMVATGRRSMTEDGRRRRTEVPIAERRPDGTAVPPAFRSFLRQRRPLVRPRNGSGRMPVARLDAAGCRQGRVSRVEEVIQRLLERDAHDPFEFDGTASSIRRCLQVLGPHDRPVLHRARKVGARIEVDDRHRPKSICEHAGELDERRFTGLGVNHG